MKLGDTKSLCLKVYVLKVYDMKVCKLEGWKFLRRNLVL